MRRTPVHKMSNKDAKSFFLKAKSYCSIDLPEYYSFSNLLEKISECIDHENDISSSYNKSCLKNCETVNHTLSANKDGKLSWRPLQIIHPFLYVLLVNEITDEVYWKQIKNRFRDLRKAANKISCCSIPMEAKSKQSDKAEQVFHWWEKIEQESINLALEYRYSYDTDIADCYGSIYTHSIAWAIHTREVAKKSKSDREMIGNIIDESIRNMQYGQTNGIPQGSVLMDFIAEIVLAYIDDLLTKEIDKNKIEDYRILRYRDDYKIFVNNSYDGEMILKLLSKVIVDFGLKLNFSKTKENKNIIASSVKTDKLSWFQINMSKLNLQKQFLLIHQHSLTYPNSGSIVRGLTELSKKISGKSHSVQIISITFDIMLHNPKAIPICCSIISKILKNTNMDTKNRISKRIYERLMGTANSEFAQIWLQRMLKNRLEDFDFEEKLCKLVKGDKVEIWDNTWLKNKKFTKLMDTITIFNKEIFERMDEVIEDKEVNLFILY